MFIRFKDVDEVIAVMGQPEDYIEGWISKYPITQHTEEQKIIPR
jgi:hypothetical protein